MEVFFQTYGEYLVYLAVLLGSFVEGESVILLSSALAYKYDEISLPIIIFVAFIGSTCADQVLFFVGRTYGPRIIERRQSLKDASKRVFYHLHRHSTLFIFTFRFIYGIRTASPIIIGAAGVPIKRFAILNVLAAFIWATLSCFAGYLLGYFLADTIEDVVVNIIKYQKYIVLSLAALLAVGGGYWYWKNKRDKTK